MNVHVSTAVFLVLYIYIKVTFKAQAFFPDAQQSKSWYPLTQGNAVSRIKLESFLPLTYQDGMRARVPARRPASGWLSRRLPAKTWLSHLETLGLPHSQCWDPDLGMWSYLLHTLFSGYRCCSCSVIATSNNAIPPVTRIGPDGHASWWTVGHVDRRLKRWELSGNMLLFNLYQNRKIPPQGGRSLWRIWGVLGTFLVRNGDVSGKGGSVWELDATARNGDEMRKTTEHKGKTLWTLSWNFMRHNSHAHTGWAVSLRNGFWGRLVPWVLLQHRRLDWCKSPQPLLTAFPQLGLELSQPQCQQSFP